MGYWREEPLYSIFGRYLFDIYEYQFKYDDTCHTITHYHTLILYFASIDVYFLAWLNIGDNIYGIFKIVP